MVESEYSPVVRVLVIADDALARAGLAVLVGDVPGIEVVGQSAAGDDLGDLAALYAPDVIVWDLGWDAEAALARVGGLDEIAAPVIALLSGEDAAAPAWNAGARSLLPPRETEVLRLLAEGLANKTIAQRLDISEHTVKFHVNALLRKLDAQSRTEAVIEATRRGLILL